MAVGKEMRKRIDNLLAVYLNHLEQHQAGWHSENDLQRLAKWKGDIPPPSGMDMSNDFMIGAMGMTRKQHAQLVQIQYLLGKPCLCGKCGVGNQVCCDSCSGLGVKLVSGVLKPDYAIVLLADRYWSKEPAHVICEHLGLTVKQFEGRLGKARESLAKEVEKIDDIRKLLISAGENVAA
jgi:hypothetical protein